MEWKIGEIKQVNGEWCQCVKSDGTCNGCVGKFQSYSLCNEFDECVGKIFKKLEKVGEPYEFDGHIFQSYRTFEVPIFTENYTTVRELGNNSKISIEIKQTKEDMEEKKQNLKPFDLEKARLGKPVCTRDGRKARIICFDKKGDYPIVALVNDYNKEEYIKSYDKFGKKFIDGETTDDLMMLPEKKEGWINVYKGGLLDTKSYPTKKEAFDKACLRDYVDTIKINWSE